MPSKWQMRIVLIPVWFATVLFAYNKNWSHCMALKSYITKSWFMRFWHISHIQRSKYTKFLSRIFNIFLPISFNICFGCSKEPSHWDGSFEYPQHMFWLWNKKIIFDYTLVTRGLILSLLNPFKQNGLSYAYKKDEPFFDFTGVGGIYFKILIEHTVSKQWRSWSNAAS